jgi:hypothetical protein
MRRAVLCISPRLEHVHDLLQALVDENPAECEISVLYPGSLCDRLEIPDLPGLEPLLRQGSVLTALGDGGDERDHHDGSPEDELVAMLVELGIPETEADHHGRRVKRGSVLISVHCAAERSIERVREIARRTGVEIIG